MSRRRARSLGVVLAAAAAAVGLVQGWHGWPDLATHVRDDAFYEFVFAHNLAHGDGPSASHGATTSGVQPLWTLALAVASRLGAYVPDAAVALGMLCHLLGAWSVWRIGRGTPTAWAAALLWLGNPLLLRECQNGQETALACLLGILLWRHRRERAAAFVALSALAVLARADLLLFVAMLAFVRRGESLPHRAALAAAPLLPWLCFNLACGGGLMPDSAVPMPFLAHANFALQQLGPGATLAQWWWMLRPALLGAPFAHASAAGFAALLFVALRGWLPRGAILALPVLVAAAGMLGGSDLWVPALASLLLALAPRRAVGGRLAPLALAIACIGIVLLHWGLRWYPRDYYAAPLAVGGAVGALSLGRHPLLLLGVAAASLLQTAAEPLPLEPLSRQVAMRAAGAALPVLLGEGAVVGSFNSGILAFQQVRGPKGVRVCNLDGVVDARALSALRRGELSAHLDRLAIVALADFPEQWSMDPRLLHANGMRFSRGEDPGPDLLPLAMAPAPLPAAGADVGAAVAICWRRQQGTPPELPRSPRWLQGADGRWTLLLQMGQGEQLLVDSDSGRRALYESPWSGLCAVLLPRADGMLQPLYRSGGGEALLPPKPEASFGR